MTKEREMSEATDKAFQIMVAAITAPDLNEKLEAAMPKGSSPDDYMIVYQQALLAVAAAGVVGVIRAVGGNPSGDTKLASVCAESLRRRIEAELGE